MIIGFVVLGDLPKFHKYMHTHEMDLWECDIVLVSCVCIVLAIVLQISFSLVSSILSWLVRLVGNWD